MQFAPRRYSTLTILTTASTAVSTFNPRQYLLLLFTSQRFYLQDVILHFTIVSSDVRFLQPISESSHFPSTRQYGSISDSDIHHSRPNQSESITSDDLESIKKPVNAIERAVNVVNVIECPVTSKSDSHFLLLDSRQSLYDTIYLHFQNDMPSYGSILVCGNKTAFRCCAGIDRPYVWVENLTSRKHRSLSYPGTIDRWSRVGSRMLWATLLL